MSGLPASRALTCSTISILLSRGAEIEVEGVRQFGSRAIGWAPQLTVMRKLHFHGTH